LWSRMVGESRGFGSVYCAAEQLIVVRRLFYFLNLCLTGVTCLLSNLILLPTLTALSTGHLAPCRAWSCRSNPESLAGPCLIAMYRCQQLRPPPGRGRQRQTHATSYAWAATGIKSFDDYDPFLNSEVDSCGPERAAEAATNHLIRWVPFCRSRTLARSTATRSSDRHAPVRMESESGRIAR
jgi:hypothetical protein